MNFDFPGGLGRRGLVAISRFLSDGLGFRNVVKRHLDEFSMSSASTSIGILNGNAEEAKLPSV